MFWIAMTIVQIGDVDLFLASVPFIEVVLKVLDENGCFSGKIVLGHHCNSFVL